MARISGVDIPDNKRGEIGLTYIFGIGKSTAQKILSEAGIDPNKKVGEWNDEESNAVRTIISENFKVEGVLKSEIQLNIKRLLDSQYFWASEAKVQCGIAMGFLKSGTRDADSISKCELFTARIVPAPPAPPPPPPPIIPPAQCTEQLPMMVYFDWDSAVPNAGATDVVALIAENRAICNWNNFTVIGHTDRSGPDSYNFPLSERRAEAIAAMMQSAGISASSMVVEGRGETERMVETVDGERNPANRRVEINAVPAGR